MSKLGSIVVSGMLVALLGCPKENKSEPKKTTEPAPKTTPPATAVGEKPTPPTAGQGKMAHCPSMVAGAETMISDAPDAVIVTVTAPADNKQAVEEIRTRAKHLAEVSAKNPETPTHDGQGDGGGGLGNCPIVLADTTITSEDVANGSKLTVKPSKPDDLPKLKQAASERKAKLATPK
jgi:hypothetical protein